jgi:hypothetical protein
MGSADDILINPAGAALRRGGASTIPSNRQLIPYQPPVSASAASPSVASRMGLFGMQDASFGKKALMTGLGMTPLGAGILFGDFLTGFLPSNALGDGTMVVMSDFGLTNNKKKKKKH